MQAPQGVPIMGDNGEQMNAVYAQDEYGRPLIILREQERKSRISGIEAQKVFYPFKLFKISSLIVNYSLKWVY